MKDKLAALTVFIGSFLLFGVQPMVGRTLLPVFGGTAAVWVMCLCAFQVLLLGGYFYAHVMAERGTRTTLCAHVALLAAAAIATAVVAFRRQAIVTALASGGSPAADVLVCVLALVGFAYVLLSANSSLVQTLARGKDAYRLYSVSNAGSLLGLVAYPFLFEPYVRLTTQWLGFAVGILAYAVALACLAKRAAGAGMTALPEEEAPDSLAAVAGATALPKAAPVLWLALPAASCFLLNAVTTHITLDVMPMPLIWTITLAVFLFSYIVGFSGAATKLITPFGALTAVMLAAVAWTHGKNLAQITLPVALGLYSGLLFVACTFLHSCLYALRPEKRRLTKYYLLQAVGGAVGGSVASLAFPLLTDTVAEYPVSLAVVGGLAVLCLAGARRWVGLGVAAAGGVAAIVLWTNGARRETRPVVYRGRGFFGTIQVMEAKARTSKGEGCIREFVHGTTVHGIQALLPGKERMPTTYYTPNASGFAIAGHPKYRAGKPMRVNITGLGVGVLFCYGRPGDYYRAYEISPEALAVATDTNLFTFVSGCPAKTDIVLGDARKGLEAELAAGVEPYDVIVVDAFTGDNLPYHLSTVEAFDLYFKLLKPDGILCVNISNWHLSLEPFMRTLAERYGVPLLGLSTVDNFATLQFGAKVALFCRDPDSVAPPPLGNSPLAARMIDFSKYRLMGDLPTDEKGSFISLVNW
jgi:hypothetical protein